MFFMSFFFIQLIEFGEAIFNNLNTKIIKGLHWNCSQNFRNYSQHTPKILINPSFIQDKYNLI